MPDTAPSQETRCVLCSGAYRFCALKQGHRLYRCVECGLVSLLPIPDSALLIARLYSGGAGGGRSPFTRPVSWALRRDYNTLLDDARRAGGHGPLLDVGCAGGRFLAAARDRGLDVTGVEVNPAAVMAAQALGLSVFQGTLANAGFDSFGFGIVRLGDVIEHVPDPLALLRECIRVLAPDGILILSTPNLESPWARMTLSLYRAFGIPWSAVTPPGHVHHFNRDNVTALLRRHGMQVVAQRFQPPRLRYELGAACPRSRAADVGGYVPLAAIYGIYVLTYGLAVLAGVCVRQDFRMTVFCRRRQVA